MLPLFSLKLPLKLELLSYLFIACIISPVDTDKQLKDASRRRSILDTESRLFVNFYKALIQSYP